MSHSRPFARLVAVLVTLTLTEPSREAPIDQFQIRRAGPVEDPAMTGC